MNETSHTLSIIIPAYNEEKTIAELLQRVLDAELGQDMGRELIVVDDCSTDSTGRLVEAFIAAHPEAPITYLKHDRNQGKGMAVRTGIQAVAQNQAGVRIRLAAHVFQAAAAGNPAVQRVFAPE